MTGKLKTILVIDDSKSMREVLRSTLSDAGYSVIEARHGESALAHLTGRPIELIICDLNMPVMDGYEFIKILRTGKQYGDYTKTPVIVLTTETAEASKKKAKEAGATGWITKPFNPPKLLEVIRKFIT